MPADSPTIHYDVFISYARKDAHLGAAPLDAALIGKGYTVWRDIRGIEPSQDFTAEIEKAIESSVNVIVCVTPDVKREDSFVRREIAYASYLKKPILIARFDPIAPPISVFTHTWIDFFQGWDAAFARLMNWLGGKKVENDAPATAPSRLDDPYKPYVENLLGEVVAQIGRSVLSDDIITLHTVSSAEDVPQRIWNLKTKYRRCVLNPQGEAVVVPNESYATLRQAYEAQVCDGRVLLLGEPGAGKTTTLLAFARDAAAARLSDPTQPLPFFEYISSWGADTNQMLDDWLATQNEGFSAPKLQALIEQGSALLLLDGLDELGSRRPVDPKKPDGEQYDPRERFLKSLPTTGKVILSSRVEEYRQIGQKAVLRCAVRLESLDDTQMQAYLADVPDLWEIVTSDSSLQDALRTPLLLALFRVGFRDAPDDARALRDLGKGDLNDRIWDAFIDHRWEHERKRQEDVSLPYTAAELKELLGSAVLRAQTGFRPDGGSLIFPFDLGFSRRDEALQLALRLDLLRKVQDGTHGIASPPLSGIATALLPSRPMYRFLHLRLRDALGFSAALVWLRSPKLGVRGMAANALGKLGDVRAIEPLTHALYDTEQSVRDRAAESLIKLEAYESIVVALRDTRKFVRDNIAQALNMTRNAHSMEILKVAVQDPKAAVRCTALQVLGNLRSEQTFGIVISALKDRKVTVRRRAVEALGNLRDSRAVNPLILMLQEDHALIRSSTAAALRRLNDSRAVEPLIALLNDSEPVVRRNAAEALGSLADKRAVAPLVTLISDIDIRVRRAAIKALGEIGDTSAISALIETLADSHKDVRESAANALVKFGGSATEPLISALKDPKRLVRGMAVALLGRSRNPSVVEPLSYMVNDPDLWVTRTAVWALGRLGYESVVNPLITVLSHHQDDNVRYLAADSLRWVGDPRAVDPLIIALGDPSWIVRDISAQALGTFRDSRAATPLIRALFDQYHHVRRSAAKSLEKFKDDPSVQKALREYRANERKLRGSLSLPNSRRG